MKPDTSDDWARLSASWRADSGTSASLEARVRRRVRRHAWLMRLATVGDVLAVVALAAVALAMAGRLPAPFGLIWLVSVLVLALSTFAFNLWNRHGLWRPAGESTTAFLELSLRRAHAKLRLVHAVRVLVAIELAVAGAILLGMRAAHAGVVGAVQVGALIAVVVLILALSWWYGRRVRSEIAELTQAAVELGAETAAAREHQA